MPGIEDPQKRVAEAVVHGPINELNQLIDEPNSGPMKNPVKALQNKRVVWLSSPAITSVTAVTNIPIDANNDRLPGDSHLLRMVLTNLEPVTQPQYKNGMSVASFFDTAKYFAT